MSRGSIISSFVVIASAVTAQDSLNVSTLFHWEDPTLPASSFHLNIYNEVWGYEKNGEEYAIIGSTMGTHFFNVTDPANTQEVAFVEGAVTGPIVVHRDYHDHAGYLYMVCDEGPSTLQVVDMQYLPDSVHKVFDSNAELIRAHNIFIDTASALMYSCGGNRPFSVYSLADPENPSLVLDCEAALPWWNNSVSYVHDVYVRDGIAYCNAEDALYVIDFNDLNNPLVLGSLENYPEPGYNHSGWLNDSGTHYVMCDETHGTRMKMLDVTDLTDIQVDTLWGTGIDPLSIPHNVLFCGDVLHASYYHDGYWLWNAVDPTNPTLLGYYDTSTETHGSHYRGAWGVYPLLPSGNILVSDMQTGLWVFDVSQAVGIEDQEHDGPLLHAWPSPFNSNFQLIVPDASEGRYLMMVQDLSGRTINSVDIRLSGMSPIEIDGSDWNDGMYVLTLTNRNERLTRKVIKHTAR